MQSVAQFMPVSIYDIADKAKVSPSTVSRALQNHPRIGKDTRKRIQALARKMDFVPSAVAKSLIANRTMTIGMVAASISDPFMGRVVEGVEHVAIEAGFNVFISTSQNNLQRELGVMEMLQQRRVDGIIAISSHLTGRLNATKARIRVPVVMINEQEGPGVQNLVTIDDMHAAMRAMEHLIELGHRRIGYVGVSDRPRSNANRLKAYRRVLKVAGISYDPGLVYDSVAMTDHAQRGRDSLAMLRAGKATAVFCYNDMCAIGLIAACRQAGLRVPDEISVVGFDDIDVAQHAQPPLTTIHQPRFELGESAMRMMLGLLNGEPQRNHIFSAELVVRQSTGPLG